MGYSLNKCRLIKHQTRTKPIEQISNRSQRYPKICANSSLHWNGNILVFSEISLEHLVGMKWISDSWEDWIKSL